MEFRQRAVDAYAKGVQTGAHLGDKDPERYAGNYSVHIRNKDLLGLLDLIDTMAGMLQRCHPIIVSDALMMADLTRHAPLNAEDQAKHDATEYDSERLAPAIHCLLQSIGA